MFTKRDNQGNFFDEYVYEKLIPQDHILVKIKERVDFSFVEEEVEDLYSPDFGRPCYPVETMFRMLFLEYYYNLSDVEVAKQCQYNVLYRYFVGLRVEDDTPDDTSLVVFRRRLGEERFEKFFNRIVEECKKKGLLKEKLKIVDASKVIADIAIPNTVNLLRQGRRTILRQILKENRSGVKELIKKYSSGKKVYTRPGEEELGREIDLSKEFIREIEDRYGEEVKKNIEALKNVVSGQKEDRIVSFSDLDARFGRTSPEDKKGFAGYKVHIAEDESEIITSVDLLKGNQSEGKHLPELLKQERGKGIRGKGVVGDGIYDDGENYRAIEEEGMKAYITFNPRHRRQWRGFRYKMKGDCVVCPERKVSIGKIFQEDGWLYYFSTKDCGKCNRQNECLKEREVRARVFIRAGYIDTGKKVRKKALKLRKMIERKFGEAKKWHRMMRARYRGFWRVKIQVLMTFLVMNVKRIIRLLDTKGLSLARASP